MDQLASGPLLADDVSLSLGSMLLEWRRHIPRSACKVVADELDRMSPDVFHEFLRLYQQAGRKWGFLPSAELSVRVVTAIFTHILRGRLHLRGQEHVEHAFTLLRDGGIRRLIFVCNHVSYADATLLITAMEPVLERFGLRDEVTVVVGLKAFTHPFRRFAVMHSRTILVAQSRTRATPEVSLPLSEVAEAARKAVRDVANHGRILIVFPEGGRSRSLKLMSFLPGVWRLLNAGPGWGVMPLAIEGSEKVLPVGQPRLRGHRVVVHAGPMLPAQELGRGRAAVDNAGRAVAALMPASRRGHYAAG